MSAAELEHGPECECTRCTGFLPGHGLSVKHGAYATVRLGPRAAEIAEALRAGVPADDAADDAAVAVASMCMARLERAMQALDEVDDRLSPLGGYLASGAAGGTIDQLARLRADAKGWASVLLRYLDALALVPTSRGRLGLDVARARRLDLTKLSDDALAELEAAYLEVEEGELA